MSEQYGKGEYMGKHEREEEIGKPISGNELESHPEAASSRCDAHVSIAETEWASHIKWGT